MRISSYAAVVLAASLAWGCSDKKKSKDEPVTPKVVPASVEGLQAVPSSATALIGIDVPALIASPVVLRAVERMFARDTTLKEDLTAVFDLCKFDLATDLSAATIAIVPQTQGELEDSLLVAKGKFKEPVIRDCVGRYLKESGRSLEKSEVAGRSIYHEKAEDDLGLWFAFGSESTLLISSGRPLLMLALGDGPKVSQQKDGLARLLPKAKTTAGIWAMAKIAGDVAAGMKQATGGKVNPAKSVVGYVDFGEGVSTALELEMDTEADATALISMISEQLTAASMILQIDSLGRLIKKIEVSATSNWVRMDWALTEQELTDLLGSNLAGNDAVDASTIDIEDRSDEDAGLAPTPGSGLERETKNGNQHTDSDSKKELREQSKAHQ